MKLHIVTILLAIVIVRSLETSNKENKTEKAISNEQSASKVK